MNYNEEYMSSLGLNWNEEENLLLFDELSKDIDIETIAQNHNITLGRMRKIIAYKLYLKDTPMEHIIEKKQKYTSSEMDYKLSEIKKEMENKCTERQNHINRKLIEMKNKIKIELGEIKSVIDRDLLK